MPINRRPRVQGRFGNRHLDPSKPLFVARRIASAHDPETGAQTFLVPGDAFDAASVSGRRLETLYAGRYISHGRPRTAPPLNPESPVTPPPPAAEPPKPKRPRAGA